MKKTIIRYFHYTRLAGYNIGLGLTSIMICSTLNRVMIVELGMSTSLVGLFFAVPLLISPIRVWLGYRSDAYPIWGLKREPYIILGSLVAGLGVAGATLSVSDITATGLMIVTTLLSFAAYGFGKNLSSNTFEALLADKFKGDQRPRAVTFFKVAMFIGIMGGSIGLGKLLDPFSFTRLITVMLGVVSFSFFISILASIRQEPRNSVTQTTAEEARAVPFWKTIKTEIWDVPQVRTFFVFVMLVIIGTMGQDVLLEPYGALLFNMSVSQTTRFTAIWGAGTMISMVAAGVWLIKRLGYKRVLQVGLFLGALVFIGIIAAGALKNTTMFLGLVFFLGISTGLSAAGMMTAAIEFTTSTHAGLLMGVWGFAHELGQALGSILGGVTVDLVRGLTAGNNLIAYSTVFFAEGLLLFIALILLGQVNITRSVEMIEGNSLGE